MENTDSKMISRKRDRDKKENNNIDTIQDDSIPQTNQNKEISNTPSSDLIEKELNEITNAKTFWSKIKNENLKEKLIESKNFPFGNYDRFYYKRYLESLKDPRLEIFQTEWFKDKKCLDIGCNDGTLTLMIAVIHQPKMIDGIDIDYRLIKKAVKNMKYVLRNNLNKTYIDNLLLTDKQNKEGSDVVNNILKNELQNGEGDVEMDDQRINDRNNTNNNDLSTKIKVYSIYNIGKT